jgi:hypothetical protein
MIAMGRVPISRVLPLALALLVTAYAGSLRLDAFVAKYGALEHPPWARMLTRDVAPVVPYRLQIPERVVHPGGNELILLPDVLVPAGSAGPRYASLEPATRIGIRLWQVRIMGAMPEGR